jgi:hypothetical protein
MRALLFVLAGLILALGLEISAQEKGIDAAAPQGPVVPFSSNGCSGFRDAMFFTCCFVHDFSFWAGGNSTDRRRADKTLRRCIIDIGKDRIRGDFAYFLIRLGLIPGYVGIDDGWGRAWRGISGSNGPAIAARGRFSSLTPTQNTLVAEEKTHVCRSLTLNPKTGNYTIDPRLLRVEPRELRAQQARQFCGAELDR